MASFKYDGKFARDAGLLMDQSKHLPDKIICFKCNQGTVFPFHAILLWFLCVYFFYVFSFYLFCFFSSSLVFSCMLFCLFVIVFFVCLFVFLSAVVFFFSSFSLVLIILVYDTFYSKMSECINNAISIIQTENLNCKGLKQRGLITNQGNFKSGVGLWISH